MKITLLCFSIALVLVFGVNTLSEVPRAQMPDRNSGESPTSLKTATFDLKEDTEVGLDIEARSPGASWERRGAEAAALLISVDGVYSEDLLLWAGDELFNYRIMLGWLTKGSHTVSVVLNPARSAPEAKHAEVRTVRPLPLKSTGGKSNGEAERVALAYSPFLFARANTIDRFTDLPLLMYYEILGDAGNDVTVRYTVIFTNEDGGTQTAALMARWGRATDIEWVYQVRVRQGKIVEETYQGVEHETKVFTGKRINGSHPLLAVASDNNNFSDLACSAVRFAPLPARAKLDNATRESVMDTTPQTYRVMAEELVREKHISDAPADINTIADPRQYLYIEAASEQLGTALAFAVKVAGREEPILSDLGDTRLRIDRSGYFRTAVRLPKEVSSQMIETIAVKCYGAAKTTTVAACKHFKLVRALMLDKGYVPQSLFLQTQAESSLAPGETKVFAAGQH